MKERHILSIDLKSFFASSECVQRGLDPYKVPLVVADTSRGNAGMCLAVSPYLRNLGVPSRCRIFELPKNVKIIYAQPRMKLYEEHSKKIVDIYKSLISEEDIHVYSIDEVFIDATDYLKYYNMTDEELALTIMKTIKEKTGITSTCGIGPNILLAKIAMDIEAKHNKNHISKWTYKDIEEKLQNITPLSKIWGIGKNIERKLNNLGIYKLKDINKYPRNFYIKRFGNVSGNDIWCKANGIYEQTIKDLNSRAKDKSISMSQVLNRDYNIDEAFQIIEEMNDMLHSKLRKMNQSTRLIHISVTYSRELYKKFTDSILLTESENNKDKILEVLKYMYNKNIESLPVRKVGIAYSKLTKTIGTQLSLFDTDDIKTKEYHDIINQINDKYGKTTILRASSLTKSSTIKKREKFKNMI